MLILLLYLSFNLLSSMLYIKMQFQVAEIHPYSLMCSSFISSACFTCFCVYTISINVYPFNSHLIDPSSYSFYICFFLFIHLYIFYILYILYICCTEYCVVGQSKQCYSPFCFCPFVHSIRRVSQVVSLLWVVGYAWFHDITLPSIVIIPLVYSVTPNVYNSWFVCNWL